jgi:hypothetical protein
MPSGKNSYVYPDPKQLLGDSFGNPGDQSSNSTSSVAMRLLTLTDLLKARPRS